MTGRVRGFFLAGLLGLLLVAAWTRLETLGQRPLWFDERFTFFKCEHAHGLRQVWAVAMADGFEHPPLHYAVTYLAMRVSHHPAIVRLPSALCGILTVLGVAVLGRLLLDARTGLLAGLLLALSMYHVQVSMDARPYALMLLLLVGEYLALVRYRDTSAPWLLVPFTLCTVAAMYTHHLALAAQAGVVVVAAVDLVRARRARDAARLRALGYLALAGVAAAVLYLPQAANLYRYMGTEKLEQVHLLRPSWPLLWHVTARWSMGNNLWNAVTLAALAAGSCAVLLRHRRAAVLLPWLGVPFLPFLLVPFGKFFDIRFLIAALPPFVVLVAAGLVAMGEGAAGLLRGGPRAAAVATSALTLVLVGGSLAGYRTYRRTTVCCYDFFEQPGLLERDGGFCRDRLILNSLAPPHAFLLRPVRRSPIVGPP